MHSDGMGLFCRMKGENPVGVENLSEYKINKLLHGKCLVPDGINTLVVFVSEKSLGRFASLTRSFCDPSRTHA